MLIKITKNEFKELIPMILDTVYNIFSVDMLNDIYDMLDVSGVNYTTQELRDILIENYYVVNKNIDVEDYMATRYPYKQVYNMYEYEYAYLVETD